jgi:CheY-like chemotaxis protein
LQAWSGADLLTPAAVALGLVPALGAAAGWAFAQIPSVDAELRRRLAEAEDARRALAAEVAEIQGLELRLLADVEAAEGEIHARDAVLGSLAAALTDNLSSLDAALLRLSEDRSGRDKERLRSLAQQAAELIELVQDALLLGRGGPDPGRTESFGLTEVVAEARGWAQTALETPLSIEEHPQLPAQLVGDPTRLRCLLIAAAREAARGPHGAKLSLEPVERAGAVGVRVTWGAGGDHRLADGLSARLVESLGQPPVVDAGLGSVTWWARATGDGGPTVPPSLPPARVVLAASDPASRARVARLLGRWGLDVSVCRTADDALARTLRETPDLVLLDLQEHSVSTLRALRTQGARMPVLLLSPELDNLVWLRNQGDPLTRAVRQDALEEEVVEVLASPTNESQAEVRGPWRILAWEANPVVAASLVRAAAGAGADLVAVAAPRGLAGAALRGPWDLVLVDLTAENLELGLATLDKALPLDVPRLGVMARPGGQDRARAQDLGLIDAVPRPIDAAAFARLLSLLSDLSPHVRRA